MSSEKLQCIPINTPFIVVQKITTQITTKALRLTLVYLLFTFNSIMKSITFLLLPLLFSFALAGRLPPSGDNHIKAEVINTVPSDGSQNNAAINNNEPIPFPWFYPILPPHFFLPPPHFPAFPFPFPFPVPSFNGSNPFPFPIPSFNGSNPFPNLPAPPQSSPSAASTNDEKTPFFPFPWFHPILPPHFFLPPPHFPPFFFPIPSFNGSNPFPFPIPSFNGSNPFPFLFPNLPAPPPSSPSAASTNDEKTPFFPFPWFHPILPPHFFLPPPHSPPFFPIPSFNGSNPFPFPIPFPNLPAPPRSSSSASTHDEKIPFPFLPFHGVPFPWFFHPIVPPHFFLPPFQFPSPTNNTNPFPFPFPFPSQPPSSPSTPSDNNVEKTSDDQFVFPLPYMGMPPVSDDHMKCYLAVHDRGMASCLNDLHSFFTTHKISISSGCCSTLEKIEDSCNTNNPFLENIVNQHCAAPSPSN